MWSSDPPEIEICRLRLLPFRDSAHSHSSNLLKSWSITEAHPLCMQCSREIRNHSISHNKHPYFTYKSSLINVVETTLV